MNDLAIDIDHVSKVFIVDGLGDHSRLTEVMSRWLRGKFRLGSESRATAEGLDLESRATVGPRKFVALDDVNLQVQRGETLGIVGSNGAGKSTLLKILSRIVTPSRGRVGVAGRVGCLLEVGTGFHPELTGRENVFLNGAILGMPRREIRKRFDEIIQFAEVGDFLDMPVKRYSNGMLIRLGFSVAAHLDPDVLIIDEVLGVGDSEFQQKSLGKARDFREQGRTVLMVSHNLPMISSFCTRAVLLQKGKIVADDSPQLIISQHLGLKSAGRTASIWNSNDNSASTDYFTLRSVEVRSGGNEPSLRIDNPIELELQYLIKSNPTAFSLQIVLRDEAGQAIFKSIDDQNLLGGNYRSVCRIDANLLNAKRYVISVGIGRDANRVECWFDSLLGFDAVDVDDLRTAKGVKWDGMAIRPKLSWAVEPLS